MATETSDYSKGVQFEPDGEGIDLTDMINMQLFKRLHDVNTLFSGVHPNVVGDPSSPGGLLAPTSNIDANQLGAGVGQLVLAPHGGCGFVYPTATVKQVKIAPGPFSMFIDEPWSATGEEFATFRIQTPPSLVTATGDATHPRIDLVEVKLEYVDGDSQTRHFEDATTRVPSSQPQDKERRVQLTYQIKQGAAAASPAYPSPTAGFLPLAAIWIPQNHNAVHDPANIRDMRMPLGLRVVDVPFTAFEFTGTNPWTQLSGAIASSAAASTPTDWVVAVCPIANPGSRLLGVGIHCDLGDDADVQLISRSYPASNAAPTDSVIAHIIDEMDVSGGFTWVDMVQIMDLAGNGTPTFAKGTRETGTFNGTPVWCNGTTGGNANFKSAPGNAEVDTKLAVRFACDGTGVSGPGGRASYVRFYIAEGL